MSIFALAAIEQSGVDGGVVACLEGPRCRANARAGASPLETLVAPERIEVAAAPT